MTVKRADSSQARQEALYDAIHDDYSRHLYDDRSTQYRDRFINAPLFAGIDLDGKRLAEVMCGDGPATTFAKRTSATVACEGYDISARACDAYRQQTGFPAHHHDLIATPLPAASFDVVAIVGGLHHVVGNLDTVVRNIHHSLKSGGILTMMEPNRDYVLELGRRAWYRFDKYFDASSEAALSYPRLRVQFQSLFTERRVVYGGGPAYFLVLMNMMFRIPQSWKRVYSPALMQAERAWSRLPTRYVQAFFVAQWIKRG
jgi:SAM-dependent methyltransferase